MAAFGPAGWGADMAKSMTYAEQLRHPNWQRVRLEVLESRDFSCECCGSKDKTLHVHHKQYIKGRMAWDYEIGNFEALCEDCHKETHDAKERLESVIACFPSSMYGVIADLLIGFGEEYVPQERWLDVWQDAAQAGRLAYHLNGNLAKGECFAAADAFMQIGPDRFMDALKSAVQKDFGVGDGTV